MESSIANDFCILPQPGSVFSSVRISFTVSSYIDVTVTVTVDVTVAVSVTVSVLFIVCAHLSQLRQTEIVNCFASASAAAQVQHKQVTSSSASAAAAAVHVGGVHTSLFRRPHRPRIYLFARLFAFVLLLLPLLLLGRLLFGFRSLLALFVCFWPINGVSVFSGLSAAPTLTQTHTHTHNRPSSRLMVRSTLHLPLVSYSPPSMHDSSSFVFSLNSCLLRKL